MRYRDKTLNYLSFILEIFDQPWKSHITTLSYWKTCNQISACAVVLQSGVKAKLLKKVFVPSLVLERPASVRSIYWIEKLRGPTTRRTLHTYILTNISGIIRFSYGGNCLFQGNVKENSDIFSRVLIAIQWFYVILYAAVGAFQSVSELSYKYVETWHNIDKVYKTAWLYPC